MEDKEFEKQLKIEKGFKYYAFKCGELESVIEELKHFLNDTRMQNKLLKNEVKSVKKENDILTVFNGIEVEEVDSLNELLKLKNKKIKSLESQLINKKKQKK